MRRRRAKAKVAAPSQTPGVGVQDGGEVPLPRVPDGPRATGTGDRSTPPARLPRRLVLIDVENASNDADLVRIVGELNIDRAAQQTEVLAAGNWRIISSQVARYLASIGAHLLHTAPTPGVRDWSDLRLAVDAGVWLGHSTAGDQLDIVSDDRAFDVVRDAAAERGVVFRRLKHRGGVSPAREAPAAKPVRGGPRSGAPSRRPKAQHAAERAAEHRTPTPAPQPPSPPPQPEPHGASREQILALIHEMSGTQPGRWLQLDAVGEALKAKGFARVPGSPRLVTRVRMLKEVEVNAKGQVRIRPS